VRDNTIAVAVVLPDRDEPVYRGEVVHQPKPPAKWLARLNGEFHGIMMLSCYASGRHAVWAISAAVRVGSRLPGGGAVADPDHGRRADGRLGTEHRAGSDARSDPSARRHESPGIEDMPVTQSLCASPRTPLATE